MQISSSPNFSALSGAQVALRLLRETPAQDAASSQVRPPSAPAAEAGAGDVQGLLRYGAAAQAALAAAETAYDPATSLPEGWSMGAMVPVESLAPEDRAFAESFGATHVRYFGADPVDDATFARKVSAFLDNADGMDDSFAADPAYLSAKGEGRVSIRRLSEVMAEAGESRTGFSQSMALFRGSNGSEYFGSGSGGTPIPALQAWQAAQEAAGRVVVIGGTQGQEFVASWAAA